MVIYPGRFEPDRKSGGFVVTFPDFGYGVTQGDTVQEATDMAQDLLAGLVADVIEQGASLPKPSKRRGRQHRLISLPAFQSTKVELDQAL
jgi:predicted RNase H-like HicB family nuclease